MDCIECGNDTYNECDECVEPVCEDCLENHTLDEHGV